MVSRVSTWSYPSLRFLPPRARAQGPAAGSGSRWKRILLSFGRLADIVQPGQQVDVGTRQQVHRGLFAQYLVKLERDSMTSGAKKIKVGGGTWPFSTPCTARIGARG